MGYRNFQPGDELRVMCQVGLQKQPTLNTAYYVDYEEGEEDSPDHVIVKCGSHERLAVDPMSVYRFQRASDEVEEQFAAQGFDALVETVTKACNHLLKQDIYEPIQVQKEDRIINLCGNCCTVQVGLVEVQSIGTIMQKPAWTVSTWHAIPAGMYAPEDVEERSAGHAFNDLQTARIVVETLMGLAASCYLDNIAERRLGEELF